MKAAMRDAGIATTNLLQLRDLILKPSLWSFCAEDFLKNNGDRENQIDGAVVVIYSLQVVIYRLKMPRLLGAFLHF